MRLQTLAWDALRWLFALFFFSTGVAIAIHVTTGMGHPPQQPTAAATAFTDALQRAGFIDPLLAFSYLVGGGALAVRRTAPLGLVLLAPSVAVIAFFDVLLADSAPVGLATAAVWGLLALRHVSGFRGLWTYGVAQPRLAGRGDGG